MKRNMWQTKQTFPGLLWGENNKYDKRGEVCNLILLGM